MAFELKPKGVIVQALHPGFVATKMVASLKPSYFSPDPDTFASWAIKTIGLETRTAGYWFHKIQVRNAGLQLKRLFINNHILKTYIADVASSLLPRSVLENLVMKELHKMSKAEELSKRQKSS